MGGPSAPAQTSLDRLKALNGLPDLEAQLREAQQLCNHSARADMILKWLLGKLKSSQPACRSLASWELLSSAVRLLSKQNSAVLLGTNGFMESLRVTCADPELPTETIVGLAHLLGFLLESAQHVDGAPIKSVLSVKSDNAASICGDWLQHIYNASVGINGDRTLLDKCIIHPILQLWALRKRSASDDELFNINCLVPALLLLAHSNSIEPEIPNKRKRGQELPKHKSLRALESLIAIHTISPARSLFFEAQNDSTLSRRKRSSLPPQPTIKERLGPLKMALLGRQFPHALSAVTLVLDIALRSVSMPTPKHRLNERSWIETLVEVLYSCMTTQERAEVIKMFTTVLGAVRCHGLSLSLRFLYDVVKKHALPENLEDSIGWVLIAEVVKMDSNVFVDRSLSDEVFDAAATHGDPQVIADGVQAQSVSLKDDTIIPIMKAFMKNHKARDFTRAWHRQLLQPSNAPRQSIWTDIAVAFGEDLEDAMTHEEIVSFFDQLSQPIDVWAASNVAVSSAHWIEYAASLVQLYSIVSGARSEELLAKLRTRSDVLIRNLFSLKHIHRGKVPDAVLHPLYELLVRAFKLWFPSWAERQEGRAAIAKYGVSLLGSSLTLSARETIAAAPDSKTACAAQILIATMCDCFQHYDEDEQCIRLVTDHVHSLGELTGTHAQDVFLKYPSLLERLDPGHWPKMVVERFTKQSVQGSTDDQFASAIAATLVARQRNSLLEPAVALVSSSLRSTSDPLIQLQFFSPLDRTELTQEQRTSVLDILLQLDTAPSTEQHRSSLILSLLPGARRDVQLLKDPSRIWHLAAASNMDDRKPAVAAPSNTVENLQILEEITRTILESWLSSKDHQWGRDALTQFSNHVKVYIRKAVKNGTLTRQPGSLTITRTAIVLLSGRIPVGYPEKLIHQDDKTMKLFMEELVKEAESLWSSANRADATCGAQESWLLSFVLDVLASIPLSVRHVKGLEEIQERILALARQPFKSKKIANTGVSQYRTDCFRLIRKYDECSLESLTQLAEQALELELTATCHDQLLGAYADAAQGANTVDRHSALKYLVPRLVHSPAALLLYGEVITTIDKDDLGRTVSLSGDGDLSGIELVQPVVRAALDAESLLMKRTALQSVASMIKKQSYLLNQHGVEQIVAMIHQLLETYTYITAIYIDACDILTALLAAQRARLQGRFHLVVALFQAFISALFRHPKGTTSTEAFVRHARTLARLLESFCSPPQARHRGKTSELVDAARKAQVHAGQYVQYILHHYCKEILAGSLGDGAREALMPGLWAMIDVIEMNNPDGIKSLSAAMNNSERAVLRSVYDDWKRFGKWEGL